MNNLRMQKLAQLRRIVKTAEEQSTQNEYMTTYGKEFSTLSVANLIDLIVTDYLGTPLIRNPVYKDSTFLISAAAYFLGKLGASENFIFQNIKSNKTIIKWFSKSGRGMPKNLQELLTTRAALWTNTSYKNGTIYKEFKEALTIGNKDFKETSKTKTDAETKEYYTQLPVPNSGETKAAYINRAKNGESQKSDEELGANYDAYVASRTNSSGPQATSKTPSASGGSVKSLIIKHQKDIQLKDTNYLYEVMDPTNSFEWVDLKDSAKHGTFNLSEMGIPKWNQAVSALNALSPEPSATTAPTPAAAAPTTAATPAATAAPVTPAAGLDQSLIQKVAAVLQRAASNPLNIRSGGDEMNQIKSLVRDIGGVQNLAAVIVLKVGTILTTLSSVKVDDINAARTKDLAVNRGGKFSGDVGIILRQVNELFKSGNKSPGSIAALRRTITQSAAPAAPVAPVAPVNTASASLDKKFVKAATLRRMRIRSQMEAAVDSSAQMGRSRVF